jgi:hypothetical protein
MKTQFSANKSNRVTSPTWETMAARVDCPADLRRLVGEGPLMRMVQESVGEVREPESGCGSSGGGVPSDVLLKLLTYSYAAGYSGSAEIVEELRCDGVMSDLAAEHSLRLDDLRGFRRRCRSQLQRCLGEVLRRVAVGPGMPCEVEAQVRIARAVQADSFALDE